jgi:hypothetical protein
MLETILGVSVGGLISIITTKVNHYYEYKKWKKQEKISFLKDQHKNLESKFTFAFEKLLTAAGENLYPLELLADFEYSFPREVNDAFSDFMKNKSSKDIPTQRIELYNIAKVMKKSLFDIESQIKKELE